MKKSQELDPVEERLRSLERGQAVSAVIAAFALLECTELPELLAAFREHVAPLRRSIDTAGWADLWAIFERQVERCTRGREPAITQPNITS